jgi:NhaP-type Na+/H+ or K+/H+ antiporter
MGTSFNVYRKKFFENFSYIMLFAVFGTIISWLCFSGLLYLCVNYIDMEQYSTVTGETTTLKLSTLEIMLMCSLLCSTDVIAAVSIVKYNDDPNLYSIIFGEGVINDAVVIIIFNTITVFSKPGLEEGMAVTSLLVLWDFTSLLVFSTLFGALVAMASALFLKYFRNISSNPIYEAGVLLCFGEIAYQGSELIDLSGICSLLTCGIVMCQFTWYNLSFQGKKVSGAAFSIGA